MNEKEKNNCYNWKVIAIVFITMFVLQTIFVGMAFHIGNSINNKETECSMNVCADNKYTGFYYDSYEDVCYCFEGETLSYQKYLS